MNSCIHRPVMAQQKGAVLFISLVLLSVITMLSLSAMRNTNLDTKIASNHQHKQLSFQAAESALFKLMSPGPEVNVPATPTADPTVNDNYFQSAGVDFQPDLEADLTVDFIRISDKGEYKFSGFGLNLTTLIYQADAVGKITGSNSQAHNRMGVVLVRN